MDDVFITAKRMREAGRNFDRVVYKISRRISRRRTMNVISVEEQEMWYYNVCVMIHLFQPNGNVTHEMYRGVSSWRKICSNKFGPVVTIEVTPKSTQYKQRQSSLTALLSKPWAARMVSEGRCATSLPFAAYGNFPIPLWVIPVETGKPWGRQLGE